MDEIWAAPLCEFVLTPGYLTADFTKVDAEKCGAPSETVDYVNGRRCINHPPRWDQDYARYHHSIGQPDVAGAYRRTMIATLADRIVARAQLHIEEEAA